MKMSILKEKVNKLPKSPGVYIFYGKNWPARNATSLTKADNAKGLSKTIQESTNSKRHNVAGGGILYIGKATTLRERVRQYFSGTDVRGERIFSMVAQIEDIRTIETDSVLEALILEANLIKKHQPKYNIQEKDDKSFSYAVITKEDFPRVLVLRGTEIDQISNSKFLISNQIPISNAKISNKKNLKANSYKLKASFGPYTSKKSLEVALNIIRKIFPYHSLKQKTEKGCLDFQIGRCPGPYAGAISKADYAKNIRGIKMILEGKKKSLVKTLEKEMKDFAKAHEFEKAGEVRNKIFALQHIQDIALISNRDENFQFPISNFQSNPKSQISNSKSFRIEAYDISNISGQYATGSMVVFAVPRDPAGGFYGENGEANKNEYRKFKIKTVESANDVAMMAEVLFRRFRNDWPKPELILLDGGQGHLNMAEKILKEFNLQIPLVAVAKGPTRKISNFKFQISNQIPMSKLSNEIKSILDNKLLIGRIIEEAHRFAIAYHKKIRDKNFI